MSPAPRAGLDRFVTAWRHGGLATLASLLYSVPGNIVVNLQNEKCYFSLLRLIEQKFRLKKIKI